MLGINGSVVTDEQAKLLGALARQVILVTGSPRAGRRGQNDYLVAEADMDNLKRALSAYLDTLPAVDLSSAAVSR